MSAFCHVLRFAGLLCLTSVLAQFAPYGTVIGSAAVLYGLWKAVE